MYMFIKQFDTKTIRALHEIEFVIFSWLLPYLGILYMRLLVKCYERFKYMYILMAPYALSGAIKADWFERSTAIDVTVVGQVATSDRHRLLIPFASSACQYAKRDVAVTRS